MGRKRKVLGAAAAVGLVIVAVQCKRARDERVGHAATPLRQRVTRLVNRTDLSGLFEALQLVASKVRRRNDETPDKFDVLGEHVEFIQALADAGWPLTDVEIVAGALDTVVYLTTRPDEVVKIHSRGGSAYTVDSFGPDQYNQTPLAALAPQEQLTYEHFRKVVDELAAAPVPSAES